MSISPSVVSPNSPKLQIREALIQCRDRTLSLFDLLTPNTFSSQAHPEFSPVGWHLGHIAFIESFWILEQIAGDKALYPQYHQLFAADGLPKEKRQALPDVTFIRDYLRQVRDRVLAYLDRAPVEPNERLWWWLIQHESHHNEIISFILQLHHPHPLPTATSGEVSPIVADMVTIPAGTFSMGNNAPDAIDNESPAYSIYLDTFQIDRYPVTCAQYRQFIQAGGYQTQQYWTKDGWQWLQTHPVTQPRYWLDSTARDNHPVCGVNAYEAEAYAAFVGKRLPTEAEWEKAARWDATTGKSLLYPWGDAQPSVAWCNCDRAHSGTTPVNAYPQNRSPLGCQEMLGNVWEWTASWFAGYEGFAWFPYQGYSEAWFDNQHRTLRGGSWATRPWVLRVTARNWYNPWVREVLAGFRCAAD
ncbi:MAG: SUMF1/EgtB/PvdO family nonheme iron enzyme [Jaaginema sp. PMC 1079.18]|nr:SUMF1/EgtB/PvdO family nonheme iron enzyme [Jaaginema sp. PMC 1080.18]MEC4851406.1 SUMF1/EgtB/PvdO family nonheme iron enzyme [Jaaginema sp. PMC 1079.18]MEC4868221.1 SUMF1/EgtB/PvdO family nonheme iron enzyme [Jaaginema sp. PMC 1078.18]